MSYIPSDFDGLNDGLNILKIVENTSRFAVKEGTFSDKGLGYKQQYSLYGNLNNLIKPPNYEKTNITLDFCYIFKGSGIPDGGISDFNDFMLKCFDENDSMIDWIDLINEPHTTTQDSNGNVVWLYENISISRINILNPSALQETDVLAVAFVARYTESGFEHNFITDLCSYNRNGFGRQQDEQPLVIKWLDDTVISNFSVSRKSNISDIIEVSFSGTFDNTALGAKENDIIQISINYTNPKTYQSEQLNLVRDVDFTVDNGTFYSGTGSSEDTIDIDLAEMFPEGIRFSIYVYTDTSWKSYIDDIFENLPVFNWGKDGNTKFFNVNGEYRINDVPLATQIITNILDSIYPVGTTYLTNNSNFNPNNSFVGTWTQLTGDAYLKIVTTNGGNYNGTSSEHKIPIDSMPNHNHNTTSSGNHNHNGNSLEVRSYVSGQASSDCVRFASSSADHYGAQITTSDGAHGHDISYTGGGQSYYPYYYGVYAWIRTA